MSGFTDRIGVAVFKNTHKFGLTITQLNMTDGDVCFWNGRWTEFVSETVEFWIVLVCMLEAFVDSLWEASA